MELEIGDEIKGYGSVTRLTDKFVFFGSKKKAKTSFNKVKVLFKNNPNVDLDWSNKEEVLKFWNSFKKWKTVCRMGDKRISKVLEVKNNMVFDQGVFYLPWGYDYSRGTLKPELEDGIYWVELVSKFSEFWESQGGTKVNLFAVQQKIEQSQIEYANIKPEKFKELPLIDYLKWVDKRNINSKDLDLFKENHVSLFDIDFPVQIGTVRFSIDSKFFNKTIEISHRNRKGKITIDNSYHGRTPFGNDHSLTIKAEPYFTNECQYTYYSKVQEFNIALLQDIAKGIIPIWDKAIESNAKNFHSYY